MSEVGRQKTEGRKKTDGRPVFALQAMPGKRKTAALGRGTHGQEGKEVKR